MKTLLTLGAAAAMALSLAACGDDKDRVVVVNPNATPAGTTVVTPPANTNAAPPSQTNTVVVPERR